MKTHMDRVIADISKKAQEPVKGKKLFSKVQPNGISDYTKELNTKCFVCERIEDTFKRYIDTIIYLYKQDESFRKKYNECKGFCTQHYGVLIEEASSKMSGQILNDFVEQTNRLYLENMKRVRDDVEWFINKFDHKYADEPWKNAKDSLTRAMIKTASVLPEEEKKKK